MKYAIMFFLLPVLAIAGIQGVAVNSTNKVFSPPDANVGISNIAGVVASTSRVAYAASAAFATNAASAYQSTGAVAAASAQMASQVWTTAQYPLATTNAAGLLLRMTYISSATNAAGFATQLVVSVSGTNRTLKLYAP